MGGLEHRGKADVVEFMREPKHARSIIVAEMRPWCAKGDTQVRCCDGEVHMAIGIGVGCNDLARNRASSKSPANVASPMAAASWTRVATLRMSASVVISISGVYPPQSNRRF